MRILACGLAKLCLGALSGQQPISTHHYDAIAAYLDTNPVFCGILGSHLDLSRITAVQDLTPDQCGTCLRIAGGGSAVYVMAVDRGGAGLDLNRDSFMALFGEETGMFQASWEPVASFHCVGIVRGGDYRLPGVREPQYNRNPYAANSAPCGWSRCSGSAKFTICSHDIVFSTPCPPGTLCRERAGIAQCI